MRAALRLLVSCVLAASVATEARQTARPIGDIALLPPDSALGAWRRQENPRVYARADLYGYIDGGAELFFEFGFEQLTQQKYQAGPNQIVFDFYRMTDPIAAAGVYLMKCGKETPAAALRDRHTVNRYQLMLVRDRFFVIVSNLSGREAVVPDVLRLAGLVASGLPASRALAVLADLPQANLVKESVRLIRGPNALQAIYTLGDGDMLQLGGRATAVAGDYADAARGTWTQIAVRYPSSAAASAAMAYLQGHLDAYLRPVAKTPVRLVFQDYERKFGVVLVQGATLTAKLHLRRAEQ